MASLFVLDVVSAFTDDPVPLFILLVVLLVVFILYLYIRRSIIGFKEGMNRGRR